MGHEPEQDVWKWISTPLGNGNSERPPGDQISDGICMPRLTSGRQLRRHRRALADEMGIKAALVVGFEGADFCQGNNEHILEAAKKYAWAAPVVSWSTW